MQKYWIVTEYANHSRNSILRRTTIRAHDQHQAKRRYRKFHKPKPNHHITASFDPVLNPPLPPGSP